jgi:hypothetical protein
MKRFYRSSSLSVALFFATITTHCLHAPTEARAINTFVCGGLVYVLVGTSGNGILAPLAPSWMTAEAAAELAKVCAFNGETLVPGAAAAETAAGGSSIAGTAVPVVGGLVTGAWIGWEYGMAENDLEAAEAQGQVLDRKIRNALYSNAANTEGNTTNEGCYPPGSQFNPYGVNNCAEGHVCTNAVITDPDGSIVPNNTGSFTCQPGEYIPVI